jgi:putative membrane protein insertion efficiency factor
MNYLTKSIDKALRHVIIAIIAFYKAHISCHLMASCRYYPTCSEFAAQSFQEHSFLTALSLAAKRLFHCHPLTNIHGEK